MNATEHLVENYYRQQEYFTLCDVKIIDGNNRQMDILAFNVNTKREYHIEVNVAHAERFAKSIEEIKEKIKYKFFGKPNKAKINNPNSDYSKDKVYINSIKSTYKKYGFDYRKVVRVWCIWCLKPKDISNPKWKKELAEEFDLKQSNFEILLFRDDVMPYLMDNIGTANYEDEILRTLSLVLQKQKQSKI